MSQLLTRPLWGRNAPQVWECLLVAVILIGGVLRVSHASGTINQTFDEPVHIACGIELLGKGVYAYEAQHPPLSRVAMAIGPYLAGVRPLGLASMWDEGNALLMKQNDYAHILALARLGNLPFFLLCGIVTWWWSRELFGSWAGLSSLLLLNLIPPYLAHSGLATTDLALTACLTLSLYAVSRWAQSPTWGGALMFTVATALAILSKFTTLLFLPVCLAALAVVWLGSARPQSSQIFETAKALPRYLPKAAGLVLVLFFLLWGGYGFSLSPVTIASERPHGFVERIAGKTGPWHDRANQIVETPIPLGELIHGILWAKAHVASGHDSYVLGKYSPFGTWYFFPVVLSVKTPLAVLLLWILGIVFLAGLDRASWPRWLPLAYSLAILASVLSATVNLGVRHILLIYPLIAISAGYAVTRLWSAGSIGKFVASGCLVWTLCSGALAHPSYLSYFNELGGPHPENILVESDLDWGQDLSKVQAVLDRNQVKELTLAYFGSPKPEDFIKTPFHVLPPDTKVQGWVAISLTRAKLGGLRWRSENKSDHGGYDWLLAYQPVARIGSTILLYRIPEAASK